MSSHEVREAADRASIRQVNDPLQVVAGLIRGGLQTRIFYVSTGGFDTHASQSYQHARLLGGVSESLSRFQETLERDGLADRVVTMVFSEFGRRVAQNASGGTDHGTAAPMFLVGDGVRPGLHGAYPSLTDLDQGDLKYTVDFRDVYAGVLRDWFDVSPRSVLGRSHEELGVIA